MKAITALAIMLVLALSMVHSAAPESGAAPVGQGTTVVPPPVGTVVPTLDPRTPTMVPYPTPAPQGTSTANRMFDDPTFERLWRRTDWPVLMGDVKRGFFWGPGALTENLTEVYKEGLDGYRAVQYFDKSRMEINNPNANRNDSFFVTNGLLTVELVTGNMQVGNSDFRFRWPADIPLASDSDDASAPTYASFRGAYARKDDAQFSGKVVTAQVFRNGMLDFEHGGEGFANLGRFGVRNVYFEPATGHNIPNIFWDFLNQRGLVRTEPDNELRVEQLIQPWYYATGFPIADAYWTQAKIEDKPGTWVLVQPYQRRVLTYVPDAPEGFKVQMGNIGQHYYDWRYKDAGKPPALIGRCTNGYPTLGFGKLYSSSDRIKTDLGCQFGVEFRATVRRQRFEGGEMLGVVTYDSYSGRYFEDVFVLFTDGIARTYPFRSTEGGPVPTPTGAPPIQHPSPRNFVVALNSDADAARRLGVATAPAEEVEYNPQTRTGGAPLQFFEGGLMVYPNIEEQKIYVLHNTSGYGYKHQGPHVRLTQIDRWTLYDDTLQ